MTERLLSTTLDYMNHKQLIKECLRGNGTAQRLLYEEFAGPMLGVCYRYTKSFKDAEDVLQDGFVKVFNSLASYKYEGELGAWIRRIMVNTALNFLKKNKRYQDELVFTDNYLHPITNQDPAVLMDAKQIAGLIRQLPAGYQTVFNLHAIEGYSHVEIGEMLGINDSTSRSQYARARGLLISWIGKHSEDKKKSYVRK